MKGLVVLSGGMDSATAMWQAGLSGRYDELATLSFDYGSKHNVREWASAVLLCHVLGQRIGRTIKNTRIPLAFMADHFKSDLLKTGGDIPEGHYADPSMKKTVVPFRNGIMLAIATGFAESQGFDEVVLGNHFGDHAIYPDCRPAFFNPMAAAAEAGTYAAVRLLSPFGSADKTEIVRVGMALGVPYGITYSCYNGRNKHCGRCGTCFERKEAFTLAGVQDPTEYEEAT